MQFAVQTELWTKKKKKWKFNKSRTNWNAERRKIQIKKIKNSECRFCKYENRNHCDDFSLSLSRIIRRQRCLHLFFMEYASQFIRDAVDKFTRLLFTFLHLSHFRWQATADSGWKWKFRMSTKYRTNAHIKSIAVWASKYAEQNRETDNERLQCLRESSNVWTISVAYVCRHSNSGINSSLLFLFHVSNWITTI